MPGKNENRDYLSKVLFVGDAEVGKSSLLLRGVDDQFSEKYLSTIGVDFKIKCVEINGKNIKFQLWDTAGQERFKSITESYYRGANLIAVCFDINTEPSLIRTQFNSYKESVKRFGKDGVKVVIVANKSDLLKEEDVESRKALLREIQQENADIVEGVFLTSAKAGSSIKLNPNGTEEKSGVLDGVYEIAESCLEHSRVQQKVEAYNLSEPNLNQFLKATLTKEQLKACLDNYKAERTGYTFWSYGSKSIRELHRLYKNLKEGEMGLGYQIWDKLSPHRQEALKNFATTVADASLTQSLAKDGTNFVIRELFLTTQQLGVEQIREKNPSRRCA